MSKEKETKRALLVEKIEQLTSGTNTPTTNDTDTPTSLSPTTQAFRSGKAKDLSTKGEHQQRMKCTQCGKSYLGQKNSSSCSDKCRQRKSRG